MRSGSGEGLWLGCGRWVSPPDLDWSCLQSRSCVWHRRDSPNKQKQGPFPSPSPERGKIHSSFWSPPLCTWSMQSQGHSGLWLSSSMLISRHSKVTAGSGQCWLSPEEFIIHFSESVPPHREVSADVGLPIQLYIVFTYCCCPSSRLLPPPRISCSCCS